MIWVQEAATPSSTSSTSPLCASPDRFAFTGKEVTFARSNEPNVDPPNSIHPLNASERSWHGRWGKISFPRTLLWRIEENLLLKQAVKRLKNEEDEQQYQRQSDDHSVAEDSVSVNDWEMALFSPLGHEQPPAPFRVEIQPPVDRVAVSFVKDQRREENDDHPCYTSNQTKSVEESTAVTEAETHVISNDPDLHADPDYQPVQVEWEEPSDLQSCPRILTHEMMQFLHDNGFPETLQGNRWDRCFAIGRDGDSFVSFLDRCQPFRHTLLVVQTTEGEILGGFATQTWEGQEGYGKRHAYYGTGQSFLFSFNSVTSRGTSNCESPTSHSSSTTKEKQIYKWTGTNDYCQICDVEEAKIAMGGGGDFGIIVEDCFSRGQTGFCGTYGNPPLISSGFFEVAALEVYGLVPLFQSFHSTSSTISSICREVNTLMNEEN